MDGYKDQTAIVGEPKSKLVKSVPIRAVRMVMRIDSPTSDHCVINILNVDTFKKTYRN